MANITEIIAQQVVAAAGKVEIPADINDILLTLQGGSSKKAGSGLLGAAGSILGCMLKK